MLNAEINALVNKFGRDRSSLMPILHELQNKYQGVSDDAMQILADLLDMHAVEVQEVVTFYNFYNYGTKGKFIIRMCQTMPCKMAGAKAVADQLEKELGIKFGDTTKDGMFTLEWTNCIGMCNHAPAFLINDQPDTKVKPEEIANILHSCSKDNNGKLADNYVGKLSFSSIDSEKTFIAAQEKGKQTIIDEITAAKLKGCGGAGFPTGLKLSLMAKETSEPKYIICNADEGEPGTFKDRGILTNYADLVFIGMAIAGIAIGASKGILYLRAEYNYLKDQLTKIITNCHKITNFDIEIRSGAGAYVCGEESALIESLEGKRGEPRNRPPFPIQNGFLGQPTEVNNVETFTWITTIISKGAKWFNSVGTEKSVGFKIFSVSGDCQHSGIYEFPMGTSIAEMLKTVGGEGAQAVQVGGASGQTIFASDFGRKIAFEDASPSGSVMVFGPQRNMLDVAENFLEFFVEESCGQCTPCRKGNPKLLEGIRLVKEGTCSKEYLQQLISLCETMKIASKCGLGQTSPNAFLSAINGGNE
jgi:[NiFe] hydrogenase diaphorase moiety large subunit